MDEQRIQELMASLGTDRRGAEAIYLAEQDEVQPMTAPTHPAYNPIPSDTSRQDAFALSEDLSKRAVEPPVAPQGFNAGEAIGNAFGAPEAPVEAVEQAAPEPATAFSQPTFVTPDGADLSQADALANTLVPDDRGIITIPAEAKVGRKSNIDFNQHEISDTRALFRSLVTGGVTALTVAALGGDKQEIFGGLMLGGFNQFSGDLNRAVRADEAKSMSAEGYDEGSLLNYIKTGDSSNLKKREVSKFNPMGDGRFYREMPDGSMEIMGEKKPTIFGTNERREGDYLVRQGIDISGNPVGPETRTYSAAPRTGTGGGRAAHVVSEDQNIVDGKLVTTQTMSDGSVRTKSSLYEGKDGKMSAGEKKLVNEYQATLNTPDMPQELAHLTSTFKEDGEYTTPSSGSVLGIPIPGASWAAAGGDIGKPPVGASFLTSLDGDSRNKYEAAVRMNGMMENMGISEAKSMGASGINTQAEAERFARSMPRIDFSSPANMISSIKRVEDYTVRWNANSKLEARRNLDAMGYEAPERSAPQAQEAPAGKSRQVWTRDADGKLVRQS